MHPTQRDSGVLVHKETRLGGFIAASFIMAKTGTRVKVLYQGCRQKNSGLTHVTEGDITVKMSELELHL